MENEMDLNLSILLRAILKDQGTVRISTSSISDEIVSETEYRVIINFDDEGYLELSLEEK